VICVVRVILLKKKWGTNKIYDPRFHSIFLFHSFYLCLPLPSLLSFFSFCSFIFYPFCHSFYFIIFVSFTRPIYVFLSLLSYFLCLSPYAFSVPFSLLNLLTIFYPFCHSFGSTHETFLSFCQSAFFLTFSFFFHMFFSVTVFFFHILTFSIHICHSFVPFSFSNFLFVLNFNLIIKSNNYFNTNGFLVYDLT
jgi:hypothetical protein